MKRQQRAARSPSSLRLRLYIAGNAPNSERAVENVKALCAQHFAGGHELEIVDLLQQPRRGLADGIIVTPTLVRLEPPPEQRVVGNLSDTAGVLLMLGRR